MTVDQVIQNLRKTIAGKQQYLSEIYESREQTKGADMASYALAQFLEINIAELRRILTDLEQCS